jgi:hypothetical protein
MYKLPAHGRLCDEHGKAKQLELWKLCLGVTLSKVVEWLTGFQAIREHGNEQKINVLLLDMCKMEWLFQFIIL